jgi:hypothetical protein
MLVGVQAATCSKLNLHLYRHRHFHFLLTMGSAASKATRKLPSRKASLTPPWAGARTANPEHGQGIPNPPPRAAETKTPGLCLGSLRRHGVLCD